MNEAPLRATTKNRTLKWRKLLIHIDGSTSIFDNVLKDIQMWLCYSIRQLPIKACTTVYGRNIF